MAAGGTRFALLQSGERGRGGIGGGPPPAARNWTRHGEESSDAQDHSVLVLTVATVGLIGLTPSKAEVRWWNRGYVSSYYYPSYGYYYPSYSYDPAHYPGYSSYYYSAPTYSYGSYYAPAYGFRSYYATPGYSYGSYYSTPMYGSGYYAPAASYYLWP